MERAVPITWRIEAWRSVLLRSVSFCFAMSSTCFMEILPTFVLFGVPLPWAIWAAFLMRMATGGVLVMKVYERSAYTVTITGMIRPSSLDVLALNALQKSMMLMPVGPRAEPTGGAGLALPAWICNLT